MGCENGTASPHGETVWRLVSTMRREGLDAMWRRCFLTSSSRATLSTLRLSSSVIQRFVERGPFDDFEITGCGGRCLSFVFSLKLVFGFRGCFFFFCPSFPPSFPALLSLSFLPCLSPAACLANFLQEQ